MQQDHSSGRTSPLIFAAVHAFSIVRHTGSLPGKFCRKIGISGCDQSPGINEDLSADLFCHCPSVKQNASAQRGGNTGSKILIGCILRKGYLVPTLTPP